MRKNYGLYSYWDVEDNCFKARSPQDYPLCQGIGKTHIEAVEALDVEVQEWIQTGRELGISVSCTPSEADEHMPVTFPLSPQSQEPLPEKTKRKRNPLKLLEEALAAARESAAYASPLDLLDLKVTLNPCVIRIRGEMTLVPTVGYRDKILDLACQKDIIFDLAEVSFIDSYGLALLIEVRKRTAALDGSVCVVVSDVERNQVLRVLKLGRFDTILHIVFSLEEAIAITQESKSETQ